MADFGDDDYGWEDIDEEDLKRELEDVVRANYDVTIYTADALMDDTQPTEYHMVPLKCHDKAEARRYARRFLELWHLEDPNVTEVEIEALNMHTDYCAYCTIAIDRDEPTRPWSTEPSPWPESK